MQSTNPPADAAVQVSREGAIAIVTINNPKRRNALSPEVKTGLIDAFSSLNDDAGCRVIVLTGAAGVFSSGGDLTTLGKGTPLENRRRFEQVAVLTRLVIASPKPVVAAVEGVAVGAGLSLAMACDYVVMASDTTVSCAFVKVGLHPDYAGLWSLQRRVGPAKAGELAMLGDRIDGVEAGRLGIANRVVEPGRALDAALEVARRYAENPPVAMALIKASLAAGSGSLEEGLQAEVNFQPLLMSTKDHAEAVAAFLAKRKPVFTGE